MRRKSFVLIFALIMSMVLVAACSSGDKKGADPAPDPGTSTTNPGTSTDGDNGDRPSYYLENPTDVTMLIENHDSWPYKKDWPVWKWVKEHTNITIVGEVPAGAPAEALNLGLADGQLPDLVLLRPPVASQHGQEGAFIDFNEYLDQMPNLAKYWEENPDIKALSTDPSGANYMVSNTDIGYSNQRVWMYRDDIFEKHDLEVPTDWNELYEVSLKLKELYPDTYPFTFRSAMAQLDVFGAAFETANYMYRDPSTSEAKFGGIEDNYKAMVEMLHKFVDAKLVPPDWLSMNTNQWNEYVITDQAFITVDYIGRIESFNNLLVDSDAHFTFMPPPAGVPNGSQYVLDANFNVSGLGIYANSKNIDAAVAYIDFLYSDEGRDIMSWGVEGETFEIVGGERVFNDAFIDFPTLRKDTGIATNGSYGRLDVDALLQFTPEEERYVYEEASKYAAPLRLIDPLFNPDEQEMLTTVYTSIRTHVEENVAKFVVGSRSLSEWDKYVEETERLGLQNIIDLYQLGWERTDE